MAGKRKSGHTSYDLDLIRQAARGRWAEILSSLGGISRDVLDGQHHPCPFGKCSSTRDAFRFTNLDGNGSCICNQCGKFGDGFATLEHKLDKKFAELIEPVASHFGIEPSANGKSKHHAHNGKPKADPNEHLTFQPWNPMLAGLFPLNKSGITLAGVLACHGRLATYRKQHPVIALPIWGEQLTAADPVGWVLYHLMGKELPVYHPNEKTPGGYDTEWVKVLTAGGSQPGLVGPVDRLATSTTIYKTEGTSDVLAFASLPDVPSDTIALTNPFGAKEDPTRNAWLLPVFAGKSAIIIHDADKPGQEGALGWKDPRGNDRAGWATAIATVAAGCRNVLLPYDVVDNHGKDLRDFISDGNGWVELHSLAQAAALIAPKELPPPPPRFEEAFDNTHRLALLNLQRYRESTPNGTLRYWHNEWYKYDGFCYRKIEEAELKAKIGQTVRIAFEQHAAEMLAEWDGETGPMPTVKNVGKYLITDVLFATAQMQILSGTVSLNSWIGGPLKENQETRGRRYVALKNGILDIDGLMKGEPHPLHPHSPDWFSLTCLPFDFDPDADCPKWKAFLEHNQEGDHERIAILMEWAGYMLLPNTNMQKFIFMEGDGANGKSVYLAAIEAMLGVDNCTHVALEVFAQPFMLTQTLGKLANIASECSQMDSVAEGYLKAFSSGDRMTFNRKGIPPIDASPTARLMISANVRPRFDDKSSGLWRRMILMPWRVKIDEHSPMRVIGMDKVDWWEKSGELPGIFNWAIAGLANLTDNKRFTKSQVCEAALSDYKYEVNPAKGFLEEHYVQAEKGNIVSSKAMYDHYKEWAQQNGYRASSDKTFGREVVRHFHKSKRIRVREPGTENRYYAYDHLRPGNREDEAAAKTEEGQSQPPKEELF